MHKYIECVEYGKILFKKYILLLFLTIYSYMKKILSLFIATLFILNSSTVWYVFAEPTWATTALEIIAPTTARVGEAIDITVRAIDKDHKIVTTYRGSIIFNTDNIGDVIPAPGKTVAFIADDNGEKKFSKGVIFKKSGKQKIFVNDVSDDIMGEATITVEAWNATPVTNDQTVTITTPWKDTKIVGDMVTVSGNTRKNSKLNIKLNGKDIGPVVSDDTGLFYKTITWLSQESNTVIADLVDGAGTVIASSTEVKFTRATDSAATYGVMISPAATVEVSSPITITIDATPWLSELTILLDGSILTTKETTTGKYVINTVAPKKAWTYALPITQKDSLGQAKTTEPPTKLTVIEKAAAPVVPTPPVVTPSFKNIKTVVTGSRVVFDFWVENQPSDLTSFKIAFGKDANSLSQEVTTYPLEKIVSPSTPGWYTWYVDNVPADTYTFKIFGRTQEGALISWFVSEPIVATIGKDSCTIGNIEWLTVETDSTKSIISWAALSWAVSYNLYKVSAAGDYSLFQNTKDPNYTLYLSKWAIIYDNFVVKALCDNITESKEYSSMSRVQSGPGMIAILVIISAIVGAFLMRRRYI